MSLSAQKCFNQAGKALKEGKLDDANNWRLLGDSISTHKQAKRRPQLYSGPRRG